MSILNKIYSSTERQLAVLKNATLRLIVNRKNLEFAITALPLLHQKNSQILYRINFATL